MAKDDKDSAKEPVVKETDGTATKTKTIKVRSLLKPKADGGNQVALWEKDKAHPGGEIFVAGDAVVEVGETSAVLRAISEGKLEKV